MTSSRSTIDIKSMWVGFSNVSRGCESMTSYPSAASKARSSLEKLMPWTVFGLCGIVPRSSKL